MMSRKRQNDVSDETVRKRSKFSGAMIKLGAYAAYSVIFLLKKLNRILCDSAKAFTSKTTALILGVIKKFKSIGRKILLPFVSCLKPSRGRFTAKRAETDLTVSSIRITNFKQFINKTVNYAVPAVAIVVFAAVLANASKIDRQISEHNAGSDVDNDVFIAASKDLGFADEIADEVSFEDGKLRFAQPYERFLEDAGTDDISVIDSVGVFSDGQFIGALTDETELKNILSSGLEEIKKQPDVIDAVYKNVIEYRKGVYRTDTLTDAVSIMEFLNSGTEEKRYVVEEGDSLYLIAENNGITFEKLLEMNPELMENPDLCVIGTELVVERSSSNFPVVITKEVKEKAVLPYETQTVESDSLFVGETEVLVDGVNGECENLLHITCEGSTELSREVISSSVIAEAVPEMIAVGVKQREAVGTPDSAETVLEGNGMFMWPVNGGYISDVFGSNRNHKGLDIAAPEGTDIYAAAEGKVIAAGWNTGGYGYFVMIDHGNGYATLYGHMSKVIASNGAEVKCGDLIGEVGTTGDSTGNHLHFEVRYQNVCQNPASYISVNSTVSSSEE